MKTIAYFIALSFIVSCVATQEVASVKYKRQLTEKPKAKNTKYDMSIPIGYKVITLIGGHNELEKQYVYRDSAKIYVSDFGNSTLNYHNILSLGDSISRKRFEDTELKSRIAKQLAAEHKPDTITLQGKTSAGYWKDIKIGCLSIGYLNVSAKRKSEFDKALSSFREDK